MLLLLLLLLLLFFFKGMRSSERLHRRARRDKRRRRVDFALPRKNEGIIVSLLLRARLALSHWRLFTPRRRRQLLFFLLQRLISRSELPAYCLHYYETRSLLKCITRTLSRVAG